jgi:hypothetical protein
LEKNERIEGKIADGGDREVDFDRINSGLPMVDFAPISPFVSI